MKYFIKAALGMCLLGLCGFANGQIQVEAKEMIGLPEYCAHAQTFKTGTKEGTAYWMTRLGPTFKHIHHYCWALINIKRANRFGVPKHTREHSYGSAIADIDYVLTNAEDTFVLLPEILTRRGEVLTRLRKFSEAITTFEKAIASKPDYWPPYKGLAELYLLQSERAKAQDVLRSGIERVSDPRVLQRLSDDLGRSKAN